MPTRAFSGGWRMRVALAGVLFAQPDLLLLDEPTNYLDLEGALWLETYLARYPHTVIVISHDRGLLNRAVGAILHLEDRKLTLYQGGYDTFARTRAERRAVQAAEARKQEARRAHLQSYVDRFRYKASKARQAQARLKMIARMEPITAARGGRDPRLHLPRARGAVAADRHAGERQRRLRRPHRAGQADAADRPGRPDRASGPQRRGQVDAVEAARRQARADGRAADAGEQAARRLLRAAPARRAARRRDADRARPPASGPTRRPRGSARGSRGFGLGADQAETVAGRLSGGQKARLSLLLATIDAPHMLILDEPTNHLDIESREALVEALTDYSGAVILVSHDMHLLGLVADRLWLVKDGRVDSLRGRPRQLPPRAASPSPPAALGSRSGRPGPRAATGSSRCAPRRAPPRRGCSSSRRCARRWPRGSPTPPSTTRRGIARTEVWQKKYAEVMEALDRAEALWIAALEKLEKAEA